MLNTDFSALNLYSKVFLMMRFIRRARMVLVRIVWVLLVIAVLAGIAWWYNWANNELDKPLSERSQEGGSWSTNYTFGDEEGGQDITWVPLAILLIAVGPTIFTYICMGYAWDRFAHKNGLTRVPSTEVMQIPSFRGKMLSLSIGPVEGSDGTKKYTLHTRQYKEGGLLRWRERQMDSIVTLIVPAKLPHIIINARGNERARRSNMTKRYPDEHKFQFEGSMGARYDAYTSPESRVIALQLFTPDVLGVLYEKLPTADVEVKDDKIWIVQRYGILDEPLGLQMFDAAESLYLELEKQMRTAGLLINNHQTSVQSGYEPSASPENRG